MSLDETVAGHSKQPLNFINVSNLARENDAGMDGTVHYTNFLLSSLNCTCSSCLNIIEYMNITMIQNHFYEGSKKCIYKQTKLMCLSIKPYTYSHRASSHVSISECFSQFAISKTVPPPKKIPPAVTHKLTEVYMNFSGWQCVV